MAREKNALETTIKELLKRKNALEGYDVDGILDALVNEAKEKNPDFELPMIRGRGRPNTSSTSIDDMILQDELGIMENERFVEVFHAMCKDLNIVAPADLCKLAIVLRDLGILHGKESLGLYNRMSKLVPSDSLKSKSAFYKNLAKAGYGPSEDKIDEFFPDNERKMLAEEVDSYLGIAICEGLYDEYLQYLKEI